MSFVTTLYRVKDRVKIEANGATSASVKAKSTNVKGVQYGFRRCVLGLIEGGPSAVESELGARRFNMTRYSI